MSEEVHFVRGTLYLAEWSHKHGIDHSIHTTHEGAQSWFKEIIVDWKISNIHTDEEDPYCDHSFDQLIESWDEITGCTEFFNIHELELNK